MAQEPRDPSAEPQLAVEPLMQTHPPGGLFGLPSQLLSLPESHVSFDGVMLHADHAPLTHVVIPTEQGPTRLRAAPQVDVEPLMHEQP